MAPLEEIRAQLELSYTSSPGEWWWFCKWQRWDRSFPSSVYWMRKNSPYTRWLIYVVSCCSEEFLLHYRDQLLGLLMLQKWPYLPGALVRGPVREKLKDICWWEQIIQPSGRTNGNCGSGGSLSQGCQGLSWAQLWVQLWPVVGDLLSPQHTAGMAEKFLQSVLQLGTLSLRSTLLMMWRCSQYLLGGLRWGVYWQTKRVLLIGTSNLTIKRKNCTGQLIRQCPESSFINILCTLAASVRKKPLHVT
jgi:hypothetical protein